MTTKEVAARFHELAQHGHWNKVHDELYADNAKSIEPAHVKGFMPTVEGIDAIREKGHQFQEMTEEMYSGYSHAPQVAGKFFSVAMGMDVKMKGMDRMQMDEIAVYQVEDGKIVSEQFFF